MSENTTIAPHPSTLDLKVLEVPPLDETLDAYKHALSAVLDGDALNHANDIVEKFRHGAGPKLDAALRERAEERAAAGTNWLHDEWYSGYLTVREPLPLTTNVGFQLALPAEKPRLVSSARLNSSSVRRLCTCRQLLRTFRRTWMLVVTASR